MGQIWCRTCGGPIFEEGVQLALDGFEVFRASDARMNILMKCLGCAAPGKEASPSASRIQDRILYHLITKGVVRVGYRNPAKDLPKGIIIDEMTKAHQISARNYIGSAVRGITGLWVSTHVRSGSGYIVGHLRTRPAQCNCKMM